MASVYIFEHHLRVPASDCTVGNHVYYARYLDWLEAARNELFRSLGHSLAQLYSSGVMLPVIEAQIRYQGAARFDDRVAIRLWIDDVSRVRVVFSGEIVNVDTGKILASATTTHVCTDAEEKPRRMPPELAVALESHVRTEIA